MGTCMSRKAGKDQFNIYTTSPAWEKNYSTMDNGEVNHHKETTTLKRGGGRRTLPRYTKGEATLFGFKRRVNPNTTGQVTNQVLDNSPSPEEIEPRAPTPRLPRASSVTAKRESPADGNANSRPAANRFGFRATSAPATNRVADSNANNVVPRPVTSTSPGVDSNRNRPRSGIPQPPTVASRFTLQTSHLPKPQYPIRLLAVDDAKGAKTIVNNNRKTTSNALKDAKDSVISSQIEILEKSPSMQRRRVHKPRPLEVVVNGKFFDVREATTVIRDEPNVITEISRINLPIPPSVASINKKQITTARSGIGRGGIPTPQPRFQRPINSSGQSTSTTSSEGYPTDEGLGEEEEEKAYRDRAGNEKGIDRFQGVLLGGNIREHEDEPEDDDWGHGEAMADEFSTHEDRFRLLDSPPQDTRPVMLSIEDQMFEVVAAAASPTLLEDEKSPVDSLFSSPPTSTASDEENRISLMEKEIITKSATNSSDTIQEACPSSIKPSNDKTIPPTPPEDLTLPSDQLTSKGQVSLTPDSPGTPTNASNSLSLSEGRDFLIDDEIADQPALVFGGHHQHKNSSNNRANSSSIITQSLDDTLVDLPETSTPQTVPRRLGSTRSADGSPTPVRNRRISRAGSVDTLSPCESIASDDLMLDFERSDSSAFDITQDSLRCNGNTGPTTGIGYQRLTAAEEANLVSELESQGTAVMREWSSLLGSAAAAAHATNSLHGSNESGLSSARPSRVLRSRGGSTGTSTPDSPRSLEPRARGSPATNSPLRPRQTSLSETDDSSVRVERSTYQHMFQDIVTIKTMLLKLKRVLSENEENSLTRAETLNPFENQLKNGLLFNLASNNESLSIDGNDLDLNQNDQSSLEELTDLRRQVVFLQQQLDDKDKIIQELQTKVTSLQDNSSSTNSNSILNGHPELINAATQTERIRPVSSGPSLVQNLPSENMGPLVSTTSNESINVPSRRQPLGELGSTTSLPTSRLPSPAPRQWRRITSANQHQETNIPTPKRMTPSTPPPSTTLVKQLAAANSLTK